MFSTNNSSHNFPFECCDAIDILMNAPIGIFTSTPQGRFIAVNPAMAAMYGYDSPEQMLESITDVTTQIYHDPQDRKRFFQLFENSQQVKDFESLHKRRDGSTFWTSESVRVVRDLYGNIKYLQGFVTDISEKINARQARHQSEERFRQMFTNAPMPYQSLDEQGNFLDINATFLDVLGYSREEIIGRNFADFLHPEWREHFRQNFPKFKAVGEILGVEFEMVKKDGSNVLVYFNGKIQRDEQGHFQRTHCIFQDVTEKRNTENYLQQVLEATDDGIWDYDLAGNRFRYSERFAEMLGYSHDEINNFGCFCEQNIHPDDKPLFKKAFNAYVEGRASSYSTEFRLKTRDGNYKWIYTRGKAIKRDASGKALRLVGAHTDITRRKLLEQELEQTRAELSTILDTVPVMIWRKDLQGKYVHANRFFCQSLGIEIHKLKGKTDFDIHSMETAEQFTRDDEQVINSEKPLRHITQKYTRSSGRTGWGLAEKLPYYDQKGHIRGVIGFALDITELKSAEEQLRQLNRQLTDTLAEQDMFFSIIAHDLKSPMSGILSLSRIMDHELETLSEHEMHYITREMHKNAQGVFNLLQDLLEWSTLRRNNARINPDRINLRELVNTSLEAAANPARQKGINIINKVPGELFVHVDSNMINTVFRNLVFNALKFSHRNGKVEISAAGTDSEVTVSIQDQGTGMDEKILKNLFSLDQKTSQPGTEGEKGTGLGMMLSWELINKNKGRIWVESEPGRGTTVHFTLPEAD